MFWTRGIFCGRPGGPNRPPRESNQPPVYLHLRAQETESQVMPSGLVTPRRPIPCPSGFGVLPQKQNVAPAGKRAPTLQAPTTAESWGNPHTDLALLPSGFSWESPERGVGCVGRAAGGDLGGVSRRSVQGLCGVATKPSVRLQRRGFLPFHGHGRRQARPLIRDVDSSDNGADFAGYGAERRQALGGTPHIQGAPCCRD